MTLYNPHITIVAVEVPKSPRGPFIEFLERQNIIILVISVLVSRGVLYVLGAAHLPKIHY